MALCQDKVMRLSRFWKYRETSKQIIYKQTGRDIALQRQQLYK